MFQPSFINSQSNVNAPTIISPSPHTALDKFFIVVNNTSRLVSITVNKVTTMARKLSDFSQRSAKYSFSPLYVDAISRMTFVSHCTISRNMPCPSLISSIKSSHALPRLLMSPSKLSPITCDISCAVPFASLSASLNCVTSSAPLKKVLKAATLRLSDNSNDVAKSTPALSSCCNPAINSSRFLTGCPIDFANSPFASARFKRIFLVAVAADDASKPALAS